MHLQNIDYTKYKFISKYNDKGNEEQGFFITRSFRYEFLQLQACLESRNVKLSYNTLLQLFDIYLRTITASCIESKDNEKIIYVIRCLIGIDNTVKIGANDDKIKEAFSTVIDLINDSADKDKFIAIYLSTEAKENIFNITKVIDNKEYILENIRTIVEEFTTFFNDIIDFMNELQSDIYQDFSNTNTAIKILIDSEYSTDNFVSFVFSKNNQTGIGMIEIISSIITIRTNRHTYLVASSFNEESLEKIKTLNLQNT